VLDIADPVSCFRFVLKRHRFRSTGPIGIVKNVNDMDIDAVYVGLAFFLLGLLCGIMTRVGMGMENRKAARLERFKKWYGDMKRGYKIIKENEMDEIK